MKARGGALREIREMFSPYCFHKKDTVPVQKLESGDYGYSNVSRHTLSNRSIVVKQVYFNEMEPSRLNRLCSEYILLMRATNRYLNPPIGFVFNNPIIVATEERPRGNLTNALRNGILTPTEKTKIALCVAYAMRRLHKMHIVHGDLKSNNVLLGENNRPIVTDFAIGSIAHHLKAPIQYRITDPYWCAPEVLRGEEPTKKSDVYSFGALLAELYNGTSQSEAPYCISHVDDEYLPAGAPRMLQAVVKLCTSPCPNKRPDFRRIYRLFKNCFCFFEGTDIASVREEVELIKKDKHNSRAYFKPLIPATLPSREEIQALITKSDAINEQKRAKRFMAKSKTTIDVREARMIKLPNREKINKLNLSGLKTQITPPKTPTTSDLCNSATKISLGNKTLRGSLGAKSSSLQNIPAQSNPSAGKFMKTTSNFTSLPSIPKIALSGHSLVVPGPGMPIGLQTSYKGRISVSDRFKTVDDVDGKNYLRLPRRMRNTAHYTPSVSVAVADFVNFKERLYKSTTALLKIKASAVKPSSTKLGSKRMTKSQLCVQVILKHRRNSMLTVRRPQVIPASIPLSKQVMPFIRPDFVTPN